MRIQSHRGIDLVVFDMDGVLAHLDRPRRLELLSEMTGKDPAFLQAAILSEFESSAEAGAYPTGAEYLAEFNRRAQSSLTREQWVRARREAMTPDVDTLRIAQALGEHCNIAMLTNNGSLLRESLPEILPDVHRVFGDRAHVSCQFNARKPQPQVFERLLSRYDTPAARAVFIDDTGEYVAGARQVGMHGIVYAGPADLQARLRDLGLPLDLA
jgi:putative hydrolase of the HAD superfamily